jgi:hypothetical protein
MIRRGAALVALVAGAVALVSLGGCENDLTRALSAPKVIHEFADTFGTATSADIAVSSADVYVAYYDVDDNDMMFAKSADSGVTWGTPVTVESAGNIGLNPEITISGGSILLIYQDGAGPYHWAESTDKGATWPSKGVITTPPGTNARSFNFIWNGTSLSCVYGYQSLTPDNRFAIVNSANKGGVWTVPVDIVTHANAYPAGACTARFISSSAIAVLYTWDLENKLMCVLSSNNGATWGAPQPVSVTGESISTVAADYAGTILSAAYWDSNVSKLSFASSSDSGITWSPGKKIGATGPIGLELKTNGTQMVVCQSSDVDSSIAASLDQGATWSIYPAPLSSSESRLRAMTLDGTTTYVLVQDGYSVGAGGPPTRNRIYLVRSSDWGATWF